MEEGNKGLNNMTTGAPVGKPPSGTPPSSTMDKLRDLRNKIG